MTDSISQLVWAVPQILIACGGIAVALSRWHRHPRVSMVAALALSVSLLNQLLWIGLNAMLSMGPSTDLLSSPYIFMIYRTVSVALGVISQSLLLVAVFGWRSTPEDVQAAELGSD